MVGNLFLKLCKEAFTALVKEVKILYVVLTKIV